MAYMQPYANVWSILKNALKQYIQILMAILTKKEPNCTF